MSGFRLHLFGHFYLLADGQPVSAFRSLQARALLAYLVVEHHRPVGRKQLAKLLWGGYTAAAAQANLRVSLSNLRQLFRPLELLQTNYQSVQFVVDHSAFWCDAVALAQWSQTAAEGTPAPLPVESSWRNQGEFLEEFDEVQSDPFRAWLQQKRTFFWHLRQQMAQIVSPRGVADHPHPLPPLTISTVSLPSSPAAGAPAGSERAAPAAEGNHLAVAAAPNDELAFVPRVAAFYGRQAELAQLTGWVMDPHCRLVAILGMGGQGKSVLTARLVQLLATHEAAPPLQPARPFAHILWSSLLNAPPLSEVLHQWVQTLSGQQVSQLPASLDQQLELLLGYLWRQRCLLVLDNVESILATGERAGQYRPGYEAYGQLLQRVGEFDHQSCLLLTSREEPYGWTRLALGATAIRSLRLGGLAGEAGQTLLHELGLSDEGAANAEIVRRYSGNPLALKLVAAVIQELFAGDVEQFLAQEALVFDDIRDILDQQFARLSPLEQSVLYWLAVDREPAPFDAVRANLVRSAPSRLVVEAMRSLQRRMLLEQYDDHYGLQNVILEYITDRLVAQIAQAIEESDSAPVSVLLESAVNSYALVKAQAKEYVRESQVRLLLRSVAEWLAARWSKGRIAGHCQQAIRRLQEEAPLTPGYIAANFLHLLLHLQVNLHGADFSRVAVWQAHLRGATTPGINFAGADLSNTVFSEPLGLIVSVAFSPDGALLAVGTRDGTIHFWRTADQQLWRVVRAHTGFVTSLAFRPDGRFLASASLDTTICLWSLTELDKHDQPYMVLRGHTAGIEAIAFSPDGALLASGGFDRSLWLWAVRPVEGSRLLHTFEGHPGEVLAVAFSPDGETLASAGFDGAVYLWEVQNPAESGQLRRRLQMPTHRTRAVAFSPDGQWLVSAGDDDGAVILWDWRRGVVHRRLDEHAGSILTVAFSPDGKRLASAGKDQMVRIWDVNSGQLRYTLPGHTYIIRSLAFSPDSKLIASGGSDQTVRIWDAERGQALYALQGQLESLTALALSPDGQTLTAVGYDQQVHLWSLRGATPSGPNRSLRGHSDRLNTTAFSPDGCLLASAGADKVIRLWDVASGEVRRLLVGHTTPVRTLVFSPDGCLLASAGADKVIHLWDVASGEVRWLLSGHTKNINDIAFSPDGAMLVSISYDRTVRFWDMTRNEPTESISRRKMTATETEIELLALAYSADGAWLAHTSLSRIYLWNLRTGGEPRILQAHSVCLTTLAFSPDSALLARGGDDRTICIWEVTSGRLQRTLYGHDTEVTDLVFSPDSAQLFSCGRDGNIHCWDPHTGACLNTLRPEGPYAGMNITGVTGITEAQKAALLALGAVDDMAYAKTAK